MIDIETIVNDMIQDVVATHIPRVARATITMRDEDQNEYDHQVRIIVIPEKLTPDDSTLAEDFSEVVHDA